MPTVSPFKPRGALRYPHIQSALASFKPRRWWTLNRFPALKQSERLVIETSEGVLAADVNDHSNPRGHAVLIHGWEGGSDSVYMVSLTNYLFRRGFSVSRLNLRDHGNTYHLNEAPFHGMRINEVAEAVKQLVERQTAISGPHILAGYSMGGNFALRTAALNDSLQINLDQVFAISPAVNPYNTMRAIANSPVVYRRYFRKKWRRSIQAKQAAWPDLYDFSPALKLDTLDQMTAYFIDQGLLPEQDARSYLDGYRVTDKTINDITVPTEILTAIDDPVIPVQDIRDLPTNPRVNTTILQHGGHCGFIQDVRMSSYVDHFIYCHIKDLLKCKNA